MPTTETTTLDIKKYARVVYAFIILIALGKLGLMGYTKRGEYNVVRKDAICPALLSISRSARDTLIVMKAEPLCNDYVLVNLK
jgi:hypothetical protein